MGSITKKRLISEIYEKEKIHPRKIRIVLEAFLELVSDHVTAGDLSLIHI